MKKKLWFAGLMCCVGVALPVVLWGQANSAERQQDVPASAAQRAPTLEEMVDAGFEPFINLATLQRTLVQGDAALAADAALQLAEGERVLLRPHRVISAESVFQLAISLAGARGDKQTLNRLAKAPVVQGDATLQQTIATALTLAGAARSEQRGDFIPLSTPVGEFVRLKAASDAAISHDALSSLPPAAQQAMQQLKNATRSIDDDSMDEM